jgi:drug/metabolite transporter (DMT)-like permease
MSNLPSSHRTAVLQALFVTFLWSTSWVLIKMGLVDLPALTFAGLRYMVASLCLLPFTLQARHRRILASLTPRQWGLLITLGLMFYTIVQGAMFLGLAYLPAATVSLILNFTSLVVAFMGIIWLAELPGLLGWFGTALSLAGGILFFYPFETQAGGVFAILVVITGMVANAASSVLGRYINHRENLHPLVVTTVSMGVGGAALLLTGTAVQGLPALELNHWLIISWLAVVNTAFAFTLWNHTLRTLSAIESSIINSTMLIQIALLAWLVLGEALSPREWAGLLLAGLGVLLIQIKGIKKRPP